MFPESFNVLYLVIIITNSLKKKVGRENTDKCIGTTVNFASCLSTVSAFTQNVCQAFSVNIANTVAAQTRPKHS